MVHIVLSFDANDNVAVIVADRFQGITPPFNISGGIVVGWSAVLLLKIRLKIPTDSGILNAPIIEYMNSE